MNKGPIFIVGLHRTGSTFLKNILNNHPEICMLPEELHLWSPYPWRTDLFDICFLKNIRNKKNAERILNLIFEKNRMYGPFWRKLREYGIKPENIKNILEKSPPKECIDIPNAIFKEYLKTCNKPLWGAKYPVNISKVSLLKQWYPNCKIIHLTRDPRAIYVSKSRDEASRERKRKHRVLSLLYDLYTIVYVSFEYEISRIIHKKYMSTSNYLLVKYEELVLNPEEVMKEICSFVGVKYYEHLMNASGKPSSIDGKIKKGVDKERAYRWKNVIGPGEKLLIDILTYRGRHTFGYGDE